MKTMDKLIKLDDTLNALDTKLTGVKTLLDAIAGEFYIGEKDKQEVIQRISSSYEHFTNLFGMMFDYVADARQILTDTQTMLDDLEKAE